ncbi:MAG: isoprenylcysteine carboxylmethyltransferase family protein [Lysobacteraceae bacterium]
MNLPTPNLIGAVFGLSELAISLSLRARGNAASKDRNSLAVIWIVVFTAIVLGVSVARHLPDARFPLAPHLYLAGLVVFVLGLALRLWSIVTLGRFFTVQVSIASDHQLVQRGPYRVLRHPSYTGALLELLGFALCIGNWLTLLVMLLPTLAVFAWRIRIEEAALLEAFPDNYAEYARRTWRLIPLVY